MKKTIELTIKNTIVRFTKINGEDYICLTDIARFKNVDFPADVVRNWMRSKMTVAFLGLWEQLHNPNFNMVEFDQFKNDGIPQPQRLKRLNEIAIHQMRVLSDVGGRQLLK